MTFPSSFSLRPYFFYKDSGVPWLGEVPEHWEVRRLKRLCSRSALYGANVAATGYTATGVRFLRTTDITEDGQLRRGGVFLPKELVQDYLLRDGDLLISVVELWGGPSCMTQHYTAPAPTLGTLCGSFRLRMFCQGMYSFTPRRSPLRDFCE